MPSFWIVAAFMIVVALAFVLVPLLRNRSARGPTLREANLAVLRGQRQEIETDVALGILPADSREEALSDLAARAEHDLRAAAEPEASLAKRPWIITGALAAAVPAVAVAIYLAIGNPGATDPKALAAAEPAFGDTQMEALVENLAQKVRERPEDVQGWSLLAKSYVAVGKTREALEAYEHLAKIAPDDASVLADYADLLAVSRGRNLAGEPFELAKRALKADPRHPKALALAGTATLNGGDYEASLGYWERLYSVTPSGSEDATEIRSIIDEVRSRAQAAGKPIRLAKLVPGPALAMQASGPATTTPVPNAVPSAPLSSMPAAPASGAGGGPQQAPGTAKAIDLAPANAKSISGTVRIADTIAGKIAPSDTLFIFARAETGSRMPLAIARVGAQQLPREFVLDDSMGMSPAVKMSDAPTVVIEARVSRSGNAMTQPGDLVGVSKPVAPGAKGVAILIDKVVP